MIVYTTKQCSKCIIIKKMLDAKSIIYETVDDYSEVVNMAKLIGTLELPILNIDGIFYSGSEAVLKVKGI